MRFFEDPDELDHHIIPIILDYIEGGFWDLVLCEVENHINIIKKEALRLDKNHPEHGYWMLKKCKSALDVSRARGFTQGDKAEAFRQCLGALFGIRDVIMRDQPFDDEGYIKDEFRTEVELYRRNVKDIMLLDATIQVWKKKESLKKGRKEPKGLIVLRLLIYDMLIKHGPISTKDLIKKLKVYRDDNPVLWKSDDGKVYELKYDPEAEKIYQVEKFGKERERSVSLKQIYDYHKHALEYLEKNTHP
jgi:hypothetical protein